MKFEIPKINIKSFEKSLILTDSATNTGVAEAEMNNKATGGVKKVSFGDLNFTW